MEKILLTLINFHSKITKFTMWIGVVLMILMVIAVNMQIFMRYILSSPLEWPEEFSVYSMFLMAFLLAPYLVFHSQNVSMNLIYDRLKNPTAIKCFDFIGYAVLIVISIYLLPQALEIFERTQNVHSTQLNVPRSILYLPVIYSFVMFITISIQRILELLIKPNIIKLDK